MIKKGAGRVPSREDLLKIDGHMCRPAGEMQESLEE